MDLSGMMTYVAALSVSTERITEFIKRFPKASDYLSTKTTGVREDLRVICVHLLAIVIGGVLCWFFPTQLAPTGIVIPIEFADRFGWCLLFGVLASGGSSFWNSALDTFHGVKTKLGS